MSSPVQIDREFDAIVTASKADELPGLVNMALT
jgi:hypothetical protein